jgi:hypothetical protein
VGVHAQSYARFSARCLRWVHVAPNGGSQRKWVVGWGLRGGDGGDEYHVDVRVWMAYFFQLLPFPVAFGPKSRGMVDYRYGDGSQAHYLAAPPREV